MDVMKGSVWVYLGPNRHPNRHIVTDTDDDEICTWSEPNSEGKDSEVGGWTWLGPKSEFLKCFKPVK